MHELLRMKIDLYALLYPHWCQVTEQNSLRPVQWERANNTYCRAEIPVLQAAAQARDWHYANPADRCSCGAFPLSTNYRYYYDCSLIAGSVTANCAGFSCGLAFSSNCWRGNSSVCVF